MPIEMLSGVTANISMETQIQQNRRYTTIQLDIIHTGDCLKILKTLPDDSVHCCVTSPPYYALRDYGMEAQIGRETTPKEYISRLTEVFTEVRRVLRPDGTLWLNISDTYAGKGNQGDFIDPKNPNGRTGQAVALNNKVEGCKPKDMIGIPWMLAFALRDTGWYLRNDIIWMKDNPMPESVKDRCARCYEHIFLFSKSKKNLRHLHPLLYCEVSCPFKFFCRRIACSTPVGRNIEGIVSLLRVENIGESLVYSSSDWLDFSNCHISHCLSFSSATSSA